MEDHLSMTFEEVSKMATGFPGVTEEISYGAPSFRVGKAMLARLREDEVFVLKCDPSERDGLIAAQPDTFFLTDHYAKHPYVLVNLESADPDQMRTLIERAWKMVAPKSFTEPD
ncbi:MmcQ/YjbR family DNA-binding protein [bacterium]|nr:MAG: MmcQ/YjbR family DNA-binding protein [bacterium]